MLLSKSKRVKMKLTWDGQPVRSRIGPVISFRYLQAYSTELQQQVQKISEGPGLGAWLQSRHPQAHGVRTDSALYAYVMAQKNEFLRQADPLTR
jgi:UTP pyrophosphatase